jgi:hypothetical protein
MLPFTDATGLAGTATAIAAAVLRLPGIAGLRRTRLALLLAGVAVLALMPLGALPPAGYVRGAIGDLSITTTVLLVRAVWRPFFGWGPIERRSRVALQAVVAAVGFALYPLALGIGPIDPYRLGFGNSWSMGLLFLLALAAWGLQFQLVALCIALGLLAYAVGWHESNNLWDYLLDPLLWGYALCGLLAPLARARLKRGAETRRPDPLQVPSSP